MKGCHKICRIYSDHEIMQRLLVDFRCTNYCSILTKQLQKRLKRQKIKRTVYRRQMVAYRDSLGFGTCKYCHVYIGEYPDYLAVKSRK